MKISWFHLVASLAFGFVPTATAESPLTSEERGEVGTAAKKYPLLVRLHQSNRISCFHTVLRLFVSERRE
jgi:hypothetical protein